MKRTIKIDGGSRGNPGPSAFGVYFLESGKTYSQFLGKGTNNEAEYKALIFALKKMKALHGKEKVKKMNIEILSDSQLLVKQMKGEYKVKEDNIKELFLTAWNLKVDFPNLEINLIPRRDNKEADRLVNEALDAEKRSQKLF